MNYMASSDTVKLMNSIHKAESIEQILGIVKQIDALKVALESVNAFHEKAVLYAKLEAEALLRVMELDGLKYLKGLHRQTAKWLFDAEEDERERLISMCAEGFTIDQIYKREIADPEKQAGRISYLRSLEKDLLDDLKEEGVANMDYYCEEVRKTFCGNPTMANDVIDGVRNRLRKAGGVGIGENSHIYIAKGSKKQDEIIAAIKLRFESIARDYDSVKEIAKASGITMKWRDLYNFSGWAFHNDPHLIHLLVAFARIGFVKDEESAFEAIAENEVREEITYFTRILGMKRKQYIESEYKMLQKEGALAE